MHVLEPQLTIYMCIVRRCWSEPVHRPEVFHKFATPRASEGASSTRISFSARIVTSTTVNGADTAMSRRSDLRARHEKKRYRFYRLSGSKGSNRQDERGRNPFGSLRLVILITYPFSCSSRPYWALASSVEYPHGSKLPHSLSDALATILFWYLSSSVTGGAHAF